MQDFIDFTWEAVLFLAQAVGVLMMWAVIVIVVVFFAAVVWDYVIQPIRRWLRRRIQ